jgi:hypothetical protein
MIRNQVAVLCSIFAVFSVLSGKTVFCSAWLTLLVSPLYPSTSLGLTVAVAAGLVGFDPEDENRLFAAHFSSSFTADHGKS